MKKVFRNIVFLLIIGAHSFVNGDVYLTNQTVSNEAEFINFIKEHLNDQLSADRFPTGIDWQMPGCAVFFPAEDYTPQRVYVAQKRQHKEDEEIANNNTNTEGHVLYYTSNMHTERQLAIVALEEALPPYFLNTVEKDEDFLKVNAKKPLENAGIPKLGEKGEYELQGTLCIYTECPPCRNNARDNCNYPCIAYYNKLANVFPNVTFHIFFSNFNNISAKSVAENYISSSLLFREVIRLIASNKITSGFQIKCCLENHVKQKIAEASLSSIPSVTTEWTATGDNNKACAAAARIINPLSKAPL